MNDHDRLVAALNRNAEMTGLALLLRDHHRCMLHNTCGGLVTTLVEHMDWESCDLHAAELTERVEKEIVRAKAFWDEKVAEELARLVTWNAQHPERQLTKENVLEVLEQRHGWAKRGLVIVEHPRAKLVRRFNAILRGE